MDFEERLKNEAREYNNGSLPNDFDYRRGFVDGGMYANDNIDYDTIEMAGFRRCSASVQRAVDDICATIESNKLHLYTPSEIVAIVRLVEKAYK